MAIAGREMLMAAAQAALDEARTPARRNRRSLLSPSRAVLIGAGAVTLWRLLARRREGGVLETLETRLLDYEARHFSEPNGDGADADEPARDKSGRR